MNTTANTALSDGAAWLDCSSRARLRATGEDRLRLLHALATIPVDKLAPGQGTRTFFLNPQGRVQAFCRLYVSADAVLLETDARRRQRLAEYLESFIIMDDVTLEDVTDDTAAVAVEGPRAVEIVERALEAQQLPNEPEAHIESGPWRIFRSSLSGEDGCWVMTARAGREELIARLEAAGAIAADRADFERQRVWNRVPSLDDDYFDSNIPHETQQLQWVSFQKGCYIGQEILERVRSQGRVNRLLAPVEIEGGALPAGRELMQGGKVVGKLTSPVPAPGGEQLLGFAILRRQAMDNPAGLTLEGRKVQPRGWA